MRLLFRYVILLVNKDMKLKNKHNQPYNTSPKLDLEVESSESILMLDILQEEKKEEAKKVSKKETTTGQEMIHRDQERKQPQTINPQEDNLIATEETPIEAVTETGETLTGETLTGEETTVSGMTIGGKEETTDNDRTEGTEKNEGNDESIDRTENKDKTSNTGHKMRPKGTNKPSIERRVIVDCYKLLMNLSRINVECI